MSSSDNLAAAAAANASDDGAEQPQERAKGAPPRCKLIQRGPFPAYLAVFGDFFGLGVVLPLLPFWIEDEGESIQWLGLILSAQYAAVVVGSILLGWVSDKVGRKKGLLIALCGDVVFFAASALAWDAPSLLVARALAGLSSPMTPAFAWTVDSVTPKSKAKACAHFSAAMLVGFVAGTLGGALMGAPVGFSGACGVSAVVIACVVMVVFFAPDPSTYEAVDDDQWTGDWNDDTVEVHDVTAVVMAKKAGNKWLSKARNKDKTAAKSHKTHSPWSAIDLSIGIVARFLEDAGLDADSEKPAAGQEEDVDADSEHGDLERQSDKSSERAESSSKPEEPSASGGPSPFVVLRMPQWIGCAFVQLMAGIANGSLMALTGVVLREEYGFNEARVGFVYLLMVLFIIIINLSLYARIFRLLGPYGLLNTTLFVSAVAYFSMEWALEEDFLFIIALQVVIIFSSMIGPTVSFIAIALTKSRAPESVGSIIGVTRAVFNSGQAIGPIFAAVMYETDKWYPFLAVSVAFVVASLVIMAIVALFQRGFDKSEIDQKA